MKAYCLIFFLLFFATQTIQAQVLPREAELIKNVNDAATNEAKIDALGKLAEYYYIFRADTKADSVLQKQIVTAELSNNKNLVLDALFGDAITSIGPWTSIETFDKALIFLDKGLSYAKELELKEYETLAYIRKASLLRKRGQYDNALQQATIAFSSIEQIENDSLKVCLFLEAGDIFKAKEDALSAYKNYNNAFDLSYNIKSVPLESETYHHFASLYQSLGNTDLAKSNLLKSLDLNLTYGNKKGLLQDYIDLARVTDERDFIAKARMLADSLHSDYGRLYSKRLEFAYLQVKVKNSEQTIDYLNRNEDLKQSYLNSGKAYYYWNIGNIYRYSGKPDSAIAYYTIAEPEMQKTFDLNIRCSIYKGMAECYALTNQTDKAIQYFQQTLALCKQLRDLSNNASVTDKLSGLYAQTGDFQKAFEYAQEQRHYKDTLQQLAAQRDVVLLEVDRENRKHEKDLQDQEQQHIRSRNIQYMGISLAIITLFGFMMVMGMFTVSKSTIRMLSFFAFICLFEFLVLLIDSHILSFTHGEPLKLWGIKIFLIALLVPIQHFLEHGVVHFLESKKLLKMRQRLSVKRIWTNMKKPASVGTETGIEEDTAVL